MINPHIYALLVGVGDYEKQNVQNLPNYKMDLALIGTALQNGLKVSKENIRIMAGEEISGNISIKEFAKAISNFKTISGDEDTFIFYFSGHGTESNLCFSDGCIQLQSVVDLIDSMSFKNKIVIIDCCYSGDFKTKGAKKLTFEDSVLNFAGKGIAILASSSANEVSRLDSTGAYSIFTGALTTAILKNQKIKKGLLSLDDINDEMQQLVKEWSRRNPERGQKPVYRSSMGGTIFFQVQKYKPYEQASFEKITDRYKIVEVKPMSTLNVKRLSAFVMLDKNVRLSDLADISMEIVKNIKNKKIYSTKKSELRFSNSSAKVVWCYFGYDESDMINNLYFAYTIWVSDSEMKQIYFKKNQYADEKKGICIVKNTSYHMLKELQKPTVSRQEFINENKKLLADFVSMAELFIVDLQEVKNGLLSFQDMQKRYGEWVKKVKTMFIRLSNNDVAPDDLHEWVEEIINLAGWILDLAILLEDTQKHDLIGEREKWLIENTVKKYYESLEKLKKINLKL